GNADLLPHGSWSISKASSPIYTVREQMEIPVLMRQSGATLLHAPHYNLPLLAASCTIVTVHDLIHLKFPQFWPSKRARAYAHFFFHHVVPRARHILTVSENTKRDIVDMLSIAPDRITVTYPAVWHDRFNDRAPKTLPGFEALKLPAGYLLYVGNLKEFKNV